MPVMYVQVHAGTAKHTLNRKSTRAENFHVICENFKPGNIK